MTEYERLKVVELIRGMTEEEKEIAREVLVERGTDHDTNGSMEHHFSKSESPL